jgi:hypothetical protein
MKHCARTLLTWFNPIFGKIFSNARIYWFIIRSRGLDGTPSDKIIMSLPAPPIKTAVRSSLSHQPHAYSMIQFYTVPYHRAAVYLDGCTRYEQYIEHNSEEGCVWKFPCKGLFGKYAKVDMQIRNFLWLIRKSQIRKFGKSASLRIFHLRNLFADRPPLYVLVWSVRPLPYTGCSGSKHFHRFFIWIYTHIQRNQMLTLSTEGLFTSPPACQPIM